MITLRASKFRKGTCSTTLRLLLCCSAQTISYGSTTKTYFEFDNQENVKIAAKRTRQHEFTWMDEIEGAVDFMDAVKATVAPERQTFKGGSIPAVITVGVCH